MALEGPSWPTAFAPPPTTEVAHPVGGPLPHSDDKKAFIIEPPKPEPEGVAERLYFIPLTFAQEGPGAQRG